MPWCTLFLSAAQTVRGPSYYRIGHAVRYRVADLDDWLAMHRVTTRDRAA